MSLCRSMTLPPELLPLQADSASKSSVFASEEPSTGQNTPQNFCLGLEGLSEPTLVALLLQPCLFFFCWTVTALSRLQSAGGRTVTKGKLRGGLMQAEITPTAEMEM
ncbi:hypothetical protein GOODEAATRI_027799 [Goodea atripinnis]|uniref:Uncharacterized protein n=1 Tax=Goodea atripinnis TaxID=208336 RepID=A0ABV0NYC2_9TELE